MNITLYKICYKADQIESIAPPFVVWDNRINLHPELCEYPIFQSGVVEASEKNDLWGFLSPKFEAKSGITGQDFQDWIEKNPTRADVYFVNPCPINEALFPSVVTQGENCHAGLAALTQRVLNRMGSGIRLDTMWMDSRSFAMCNYFVGNTTFWTQYLGFVNAFLQEVDTVPEDHTMLYETSAGYGPNGSLPFYAFVVERLFSIFLNLGTVKIDRYAYTKNDLLAKTGLDEEAVDEIMILSSMKQAGVEGGRSELLSAWSFYRNRFAQAHPTIFGLE